MRPPAISDEALHPRRDEPDGAPRIAGLDVIRGLAILGILFMNINEMGGSIWASFDDVRHFGWSGADRAAWWLREILADGTARGLLQLLFGAGMLILTDRAAEQVSDVAVVLRYWWRNLVLLAFGLAHLFLLLWPGDILHTYAIAAMVVVLARRCRPSTMLLLGLTCAVAQLTSGGLSYLHARQVRAEGVEARARQAAGQPITTEERRAIGAAAERRRSRASDLDLQRARIDREDAARRRDAAGWAGSAWASIVSVAAAGLEVDFVWEAAAAMLIGAAFYRWGIIQGARSRRCYAALMVAGYAVGLPLRYWSAAELTRFDGGPNVDWATYELARLATTIGHLGLIHLLLATGVGARLLRPFAAAGRTALSIYVLQTIVCLWVLYPPWGFALYGRQGWMALMLTAAAIDAGLLLLAVWWMRRFRIAPVEWAWRSIVERRRLPFRRRDTAADHEPIPA